MTYKEMVNILISQGFDPDEVYELSNIQLKELTESVSSEDFDDIPF